MPNTPSSGLAACVLLALLHSTLALLHGTSSLLTPRAPSRPALRRGCLCCSSSSLDAQAEPPSPPGALSPPAEKPMRRRDAGAIIAGSAIGGGFLALPAITAPLGYMPSAFGLVFVWCFLVTGAIALTEAAGHVLMEDDGNADPDSSPETQYSAVTITTVTRRVFGSRFSIVTAGLFVAQILAMLTAQVVKGGEMCQCLLGWPYALGCIAPTLLFGLFAFGSQPRVVEAANTGLTAMMLGGFAALVAAALSLRSSHAAPLPALAKWAALLPRRSAPSSWAVPVFMNLLTFGQCIPLIVEGVVVRATSPPPATDDDAVGGTPTAPAAAAATSAPAAAAAAAARPLTVGEQVKAALSRAATEAAKYQNAFDAAPYKELVVPTLWRREGWAQWERQESAEEEEGVAAARSLSRLSALRRARNAIVFGSLIPLLLCLGWTAVSTALVSPAPVVGADPVVGMLTGGVTRVALPVGLLAGGAIGTTLLGSFLAMGHFAADALCMGFGVCSPAGLLAARSATVALPTLLALAGPGLYLPMLAFAGAFPATILYGLLPPLAAAILRKRAKPPPPGVPRLRLLPGGVPTLAAQALLAAAMLGASVVLATEQAARPLRAAWALLRG